MVQTDDYRGIGGYQDYDANEFKIYSKASDMFALACCIFEIFERQPLLLYPNLDVCCKEYGRAFMEGRCVGTLVSMEKSPRELLSVRVTKVNCLAPILKGLVAERRSRYTIEQVLSHTSYHRMLRQLSEKHWKLDNGSFIISYNIVCMFHKIQLSTNLQS